MFDLETDAGIARLTLQREPVNAISAAWLEEFHGLLDALDAREDWRLLHLRSAQKVFCAGADLAEMRACLVRAGGADAMVATAAGMQDLFARLEALPQVTLAELGGAGRGTRTMGGAARAEALAAPVAALPGAALRACKSCIAAAGDPQPNGYDEELAQSCRLYLDETTRQRVAAFLAGELS